MNITQKNVPFFTDGNIFLLFLISSDNIIKYHMIKLLSSFDSHLIAVNLSRVVVDYPRKTLGSHMIIFFNPLLCMFFAAFTSLLCVVGIVASSCSFL